jgi:hypothetical protein
MGRFNEDDILEYEKARQRALERMDSDRSIEGGLLLIRALPYLLGLGLVIGVIAWLHGQIAKITGPEVATQIAWGGVVAASVIGIWLFVKRRIERAEDEQQAMARGRDRARDAIIRAQGDRPGLFAEYWTSEGEQRHGNAALLDLNAAIQLVINVYGEWTILALASQGHDRLLEDDIVAVFGVDRGVRVTDAIWARMNEE